MPSHVWGNNFNIKGACEEEGIRNPKKKIGRLKLDFLSSAKKKTKKRNLP